MSSIHKPAFSVSQLSELLESNNPFFLVDTRSEAVFEDGFISGSVFIGQEGNFIEWALNLLDAEKPIYLVAAPGKEETGVALLKRAGFENVKGFLDGGFEAWKDAGKPVDMIIGIDADEIAMDIRFDKNLVVVDVRLPVEYAQGHVENAVNIPLMELKDPANIASFEERDNLYLHSGRGYRSVIAASLLKREGYNNLHHISGGWEELRHTKGIPIVKEPKALN